MTERGCAFYGDAVTFVPRVFGFIFSVVQVFFIAAEFTYWMEVRAQFTNRNPLHNLASWLCCFHIECACRCVQVRLAYAETAPPEIYSVMVEFETLLKIHCCLFCGVADVFVCVGCR